MFNPELETKKIIQFIQDYFEKCHLGGIVIGISGGKDSAVAAALFTKALGPERVIGVTMPCHSIPEDRNDAIKVADFYHFQLINVDLTNTFDTFHQEVEQLEDFVESEDSNINIKPRLRMSTLYYIAQMVSKKEKKTYIVSGNGNKCEEYVGYFTKGGDSVSDIKLLADFTVEEVIQLGEVLEVPKEVLYKTPSDGISQTSDEDKLGVSYKDIAKVIHGEEVEKEVLDKITKMHNGCAHKFNIPTYRRDENK